MRRWLNLNLGMIGEDPNVTAVVGEGYKKEGEPKNKQLEQAPVLISKEGAKRRYK